MCHGLIDSFRNNMLLWLSDTLGTAAHTVKLLTVGLFLRSTGFRNVGWVGLGHMDHVDLCSNLTMKYFINSSQVHVY